MNIPNLISNHRESILSIARGFVPCATACLLLVASLAKLRSQWTPSIFGLAGLDEAVAVVIPSFELALALRLLWCPQDLNNIYVAIVLFSVFTVYLIIFDRTPGAESCSCGGGEQFFSAGPHRYAFSIIRNVTLTTILTAYLLLRRRSSRGLKAHLEEAP